MYNQNSDLMKQEKFMLPTMIEGDFSAEELAEDADGLQMSFQRVKIPAGGTLQFEMPSDDPDNPERTTAPMTTVLLPSNCCRIFRARSWLRSELTPIALRSKSNSCSSNVLKSLRSSATPAAIM